MNLQAIQRSPYLLGLMVALGVPSAAYAAEESAEAEAREESAATSYSPIVEPEVEEMVVIARFYSAAQALVNERIDDEVVTDVSPLSWVSGLSLTMALFELISTLRTHISL